MSGKQAQQNTKQQNKEPKDGTIHVTVLKATDLPTIDFAKQQDPYVVVRLEGSDPKSWATTDPVYGGGSNPEWKEQDNNELEVFYDTKWNLKEDLLTFELFSDDNVIGSAQLNVTKIVKNQVEEPTNYTMRLKEGRGEVHVAVWFGPPIRKAFRAAQRAGKLLEARDSFVATLWAALLGPTEKVSKRLDTEWVKKNKKVSVAIAAVLGVIAAGGVGLFLTIAIPTTIVAAFTFPFWIIPFLLTTLFTSPIWIPVVLVTGAVLSFVATFVFGLGVTSRPVRSKGAYLTTKLKQTEVGKRVVYEKTE